MENSRFKKHFKNDIINGSNSLNYVNSINLDDLERINKPDIKTGVYFLFKDNKLVYIGKAIHIFKRISDHIHESIKDFDNYSYVEVELEKLDFYEKLFILKYCPEHNKDNFSNRDGVKIGLDETIIKLTAVKKGGRPFKINTEIQ